MHPNPKIIIPVLLLVVAALGVGAYFVLQDAANRGAAIFSGTVEADEYHLGSLVGGRISKVYVKEGDQVREGDELVEVRPLSGSRDVVRAPVDGVVLTRSVQPGEIAAAGAPLVTLADLEDLTLTVYVPEDRYGQISLGQAVAVTVDSYPGEVFTGVVSHIADQAEFTPRNVQTTDSRKSTVFAIQLTLQPSGGKLKPGMPADAYLAVAGQ